MKNAARILLVDDDLTILTATQRILKSAGYEVLTAGDGNRGLDLVRSELPDLVLLDVNLPGLSGHEVCRQIKSDPALEGILILMASASATDSESQAQGLDVGADGYISRPISNRELVARIEAMLRLKSAKDALKKKEQQTRALYESMAEMFVLYELVRDPEARPVDYRLLDCNPAFESSLGISRAQALGALASELYGTGEPPFLDRYRAVVETGEPASFETEFILRGKVFSTSVFSPEPNRFATISTDITERKRAEKQLLESEALFRAVVDQSHDGILFLDSNRKIMYVSSSFADMIGKPPAELIGHFGYEFVHPDDRESNTSAFLELLQRPGGTSLAEYRIQHQDGLWRWVETNATNLLNEPHIQAVILTSRDVTERQRAEALLREQKARYHAILQTALDGFWLTDLQGRLLEVNEAYCRMSGYSLAELRTMRIADLEAHETAQDMAVHIYKIITQGKNRFESRHRRKDGSLFEVEVSVQYREAEGGQFVVFLRDITDRKRSEAALRLSEQTARQTAEQLQRVNQIGVKISAGLDLERVLQTIYEQCQQIGDTDTFYVAHYDDATGRLSFPFYCKDGERREISPRNIQDSVGLTGYVIEQREVLYVTDDSQLPPSATPIRQPGIPTQSYIGVPLILNDQVVGVLSMQSHTPGAYRPEQVQALELVATQAAIAIQNSQLYEQSRQELAERKRAEERLRQSERRLKEAQAVGRIGDWELDLTTGELTYSDEMFTLLERDPALGAPPIYESTAYLLPQDALVLQRLIQQAIETGSGWEHDAHVPLSGGRMAWHHGIGVAIKDEQGDVIKLHGVAQDITERKLADEVLQKRVAELEMLYESGLALSHLLDPKEIGEKIIALLEQKLNWHHTVIRLYQPQQQLLELLAFSQPDLKDEQQRREAEERFYQRVNRLGEGLSGWAVQNRQSFRSGNIRQDPHYRATYPGIQSGLYVLMQSGENIVGVISIESELPEAFTEADQRLATTLANQAAVAIENARLTANLEQRVKERTAEVEDLYNHAPTGYHSLDENGLFVMINQTELNWLGYAREEVVGKKSFRDLVTPPSQQVFAKNFPLFKAQGWIKDLEFEMIRKDGSTFPVLLNATAIYEAQGQFLYSRSTMFDITERKQAEAAARKLSLAIEASPVSVAITDREGRIEYVNPRFCAITGYSREEVLGKNPRILKSGLHPSVFYQTMWSTLLAGQSWYGELYNRRKNGELFWEHASISPVKNESGETTHYVAVKEDVTEQKKAEAALRESRDKLSAANAALEKASRLKDEFLASMSHELRTPLTSILGLSEALQLQAFGELNAKQIKSLKTIENSGRHLLELINDILDLSKIEAGKLDLQFEPCAAADICRSSLQLVKGMAHQKQQNISFSIHPETIIIRADVRRLKQMLVNLLSNAVKFTPEGGLLGLEVQTNPDEKTVSFSVWDQGIGIQPEDLDKLFVAFVQLDSRLARQYSGTGLGLSLVQRMTELHGGSLRVESVPGEGSRFTILLPWSVDVTQPVPGLIRPALSSYRNALINVLTIDDNELDVERTTRYLQEFGITNLVQPTLRGALEKAVFLRPSAILLDLNLPDGLGLELLSRLKADARTHDIPVIITSVDERRAEAAQLGALGYLVKPISQQDLRAELAKAVSFSLPTSAGSVIVSEAAPLVLVADDNEQILEMVTDFLEAQRFRVVAARSGFELLERAPELHPELMLVDIQMPGLDGLEAIRRLRAHRDPALASTPIIAITALAMTGDREKCLQAGANEYMSKPIGLTKLLERIRQFLKEKSR
jgi:PAS domain S-box-containing protein